MTTEEALKKLEETNKIDSIGHNPGWIIDLYNQRLENKKEKDFRGNIRSMNQFYIKLIIETIEQKRAGMKNPVYKSSSFLI